MRTTRQRVLVTGGAGFLGSHLCERLLADGNDVLCVDNFFTGSRDNVAHLLDDSRFELMRHDVTFPLYVEVDQIYNLACPASPVHYQFDPVQTTKTSVIGAINMLGLAKRMQGPHPPVLHQRGLRRPDRAIRRPRILPRQRQPAGSPRLLRRGQALRRDAVLRLPAASIRMPIKVARIFNTYGPRMHPNDGRVVSSFIVQALLGEDITLFGDGSQTRAFCFVDDLIDGFVRLMATGDDVTGPVNLGNPHEISVRELAERVIALTGSRSQLVFRPLPQDDPLQRCPDIALARSLLDWEPKVPLADGLTRTIRYFERLLNTNGASRLPAHLAAASPVA